MTTTSYVHIFRDGWWGLYPTGQTKSTFCLMLAQKAAISAIGNNEAAQDAERCERRGAVV